MLWNLDEHWTELKRLEDVKQAYDIGLRETPFEIYRQTGYALGEFLGGILPALLQICIMQAACTVLGAGIGAAIGAAFGGVGAVPGGLWGAEVGFSVGATILSWMGLGFLFLAVGANLIGMIVQVRLAVMRAWRAADTAPDQRSHEVRQAGQDLARAMGTFMLLILQAIVAWVLKRGVNQAPELYADLRKSKLGEGFTSWVEQNLDRLMKDAKLRPRQAQGSSAQAPAEPPTQSPSQLARKAVREEAPPPKINEGQQGKHIPDHNNFQPGKSELTDKNPQRLLDESAGQGQKIGETPVGQPGSKERVNFGKIIGNYVDPVTGNKTPSTNGIIHYGSRGAHIVPSRP